MFLVFSGEMVAFKVMLLAEGTAEGITDRFLFVIAIDWFIVFVAAVGKISLLLIFWA